MSDDEVTSASALSDAVQSLLCRAHDNDVDIEGGLDCRNGPDYPDWDVIITEVEKNDD